MGADKKKIRWGLLPELNPPTPNVISDFDSFFKTNEFLSL